jgi:DNA-binding response OmpR family regulator
MPAMNPRLLLLEDDPVSAAFLRQALAALPAQVEHAGTVCAARTLADAGQVLWLFDARLPDGDGASLLAELRGRGLQVPALALTAEDQAPALERLRAAGFAKVLAKPLAAEALRSAAREAAPGLAPAWDDAMALASLGGSLQAVRSLRELFLAELPVQAGEVSAALARGDLPRAQAQLHRLKASCGFVGAPALLLAVQALSQAPGDVAARDRFERRARALSG